MCACAEQARGGDGAARREATDRLPKRNASMAVRLLVSLLPSGNA
jgi:hypothetical protein